MNRKTILRELKTQSNPKNVEGMARFGIRPKTKVLGISVTELRRFVKKIGRDHKLARQLWKENIHEARILSVLIEEIDKVTERQMDTMIKKFDSWDICDLACANVFAKLGERSPSEALKKRRRNKTPNPYRKAIEWSKLESEFEKRAGYALMACLALHDKEASDSKFTKFFPHIKRGATDERNFVKKAVNWALRQIGKRNRGLNNKSIKLAKEIEKIDSKSARWIAKDALRELTKYSFK
jgi:3-methyladenine DNA glycosylase AlkD